MFCVCDIMVYTKKTVTNLPMLNLSKQIDYVCSKNYGNKINVTVIPIMACNLYIVCTCIIYI